MIIDELITDRTLADVTELKNLLSLGENMSASDVQRFLQNLKGAYNYSDLNRVAEACIYIAEELASASGGSFSVDMKTDWTESDYVSSTEKIRYLNGVRAIHDASPVTVPDVPSNISTVTDANNIELILREVHNGLQRMMAFMYYSGDVYSGEV